jgi:hypothetical protein
MLFAPERKTKERKLTQVPNKVFQEMIASNGLSVAQMNEQGKKVVLFFSTSLGNKLYPHV